MGSLLAVGDTRNDVLAKLMIHFGQLRMCCGVRWSQSLMQLPMCCWDSDCSTTNCNSPKPACIVEAKDSTRDRLEGTLRKDHEDEIAGKGGKARENVSVTTDGNQEHKRGPPGGTQRRKNSKFRCTDGHLSSQECGVRTTISKIQRPSGTPR